MRRASLLAATALVDVKVSPRGSSRRRAGVGPAMAAVSLIAAMPINLTLVAPIALVAASLLPSPAQAQSARGGAGGQVYAQPGTQPPAAGGGSGQPGGDSNYNSTDQNYGADGAGGGGANASGGNARDRNGAVIANTGGAGGTAGGAGGTGQQVGNGSSVNVGGPSYSVSNAGGGGGGGDAATTASGTLTAPLTGGAGGAGGAGGGTAGGGGGGAGGAGINVAGPATFTVDTIVGGGVGGGGGISRFGTGGMGGGGGYGIATTGTSAVTVTSGGIVRGGIGGAGGDNTDGFSNGGPGGAGGAGVYGSGTLNNAGSIAGGAGGAAGRASTVGAGGAGVVGADLAVTNTGTIAAAGTADAITFTGGTNSLLLTSGGTTGTLTGGIGITGSLTVNPGVAAGIAVTLANLLHDTAGGAGSLTKTGAGSLTLGAVNTYSGGTTVSQGVLTGTANSFGSGAIVDNTTLAIVQAAAGTLANTVSGSGGITVTGLTAGNALTFSGTLTNSGGITVTDASRVKITGSLSTGGNVAFASGAGATLDNQGSVAATVGGVPGTASFTAGGTVINGAAGNTAAALSGSYAAIYTTGGALGVTNFGVVSASGYAIVTQGGNGANPTSLTLTNSGTIVGGANGIVARDTTSSNSITNSGRIQSGSYNAGTGAITASAMGTAISVRAATAVTNLAGGAIVGGTDSFSTDDAGIFSAGNGLLKVTNAGSIVGGYAGVQTFGTVQVSNSGTIATGSYATPTAGNPSGVTVGGAGFAVTGSSLSVTNTGTINSTGASIYQAGSAGTLNLVNTGTLGGAARAIDPDDTVIAAGAATILNSGTITTPAYYGVVMNGGGTLTNATGGSITAGNAGGRYGVFTNGAAGTTTTINNYGTITGTAGLGIQGGAGATFINLYAGSTTGAIATGSGNDTLQIYNGQVNATAATTGYADAVSGALGTVTLQNSGTVTAASVGTVNLGTGTNNVFLRGTGTGTAAASGAFSLAGTTINGTLTKQDSGTWTLSGTGNAGLTQINAGTGGSQAANGILAFNGTGLTSAIVVNGAIIRSVSSGAFGTGTIFAADPTIQFAANTTETNNFVLQTNDPTGDPTRFQVGSGVTATLTGTISQGTAGGTNMGGQTIAATQPLVFEQFNGGTGTIILTNAANNYNGTTTINAGTTVVERDTGAALGTGIITVGSGAVLQFDNQTGALRAIEQGRLEGAGTLRFTGNANAITSFGGSDISTPGASPVAIALSQGALIDVVSGTVYGARNEDANWTANRAGLTIAAGAVFDSVEGAIIVDALNGAGTLQGGYLGRGSVTVGIGGSDGSFSGIAQDSPLATATPRRLNLIKAGAGTQTLTGANTYTGTTTISGGTLALGGTGTLAASAITNNATFDITGHTGGVSVLNLLGSGTTTLGLNTLTITAASGAYAGSFTGSGGVTKQGAATYILAGASTATGTTTVSGGVLALGAGGATGSVAGTIALQNGSLLQVNRTGTPTLANTIGGTGSVELVRSATLTGAVTATGGVTVDAGVTATLSSVSGAYQAVTVVGTGATVNVAMGGVLTGANSGVYTNAGTTTQITNRGTVQATGANNNDDAITARGTVAVDNYGTIKSTGNNAGIVLFANGNTVTNYTDATITGGTSGNGAHVGYAVNMGGNSTLINAGTLNTGGPSAAVASYAASSVTNTGTITGSADATYGYGIQAFAGATGSITNNAGLIEGGRAGIGLADTSQTVNNAAVIRGTNATSYGIESTAGTNTINNLAGGIIVGRTAGFLSTVAGGGVTNAGLIAAGSYSAGTTTVGNNATAVSLTSGAVTNQAGGRIVAGTTNTTNTNYGVLATGALTLTNAAATTVGGVTTRAGQIVGGYTGVEVRGLADITNNGLIASGTVNPADTGTTLTSGYTLGGQDGVRLLGGGTVTNNAGALIRSAASAVYAEGTAASALINAGTLASANGFLTNSANQALTATNTTGGLIVGTNGYGIYNAGAGLSRVVANAGTIVGTSAGLYANGAVDVTNSGVIGAGTLSGVTSGTFTASGVGRAISAGAGATIRNNGGSILAADGVAVYISGALATGSVNSGIIASSTNAALYVGGDFALFNSGDLAGYRGVESIGSAAGNALNNAGRIVTGSIAGNVQGGAYTINASGNDAVRFAGGTITNGSVTNHAALIYGQSDGIYGNGAGQVNVDNYAVIRTNDYAAVELTQAGTVHNFAGAAITGGNRNTNATDTGTGVRLLAGGAVLNDAGAAITATAAATNIAVLATAGTLNVTSGGTIAGAAYAIRNTGAGVSTITLNAGSITTGAIQLGAAADVVTLFNGQGTGNGGTLTAAAFGAIDLGGGIDTVQLRGSGDGSAANGAAGSLSLAGLTGAEVLRKFDTGTWTLSGAAATPALTIYAGDGGQNSDGLLIFNGTTGLTGSLFVNGATIRALTSNAFGTGTVFAQDPTMQFAAGTSHVMPIVLQSANPTTDPTTLQAGNGALVTLNGSITQTGAPAQPLVFGLYEGGTGGFILTNTANNWAGTTTVNANTTLRGTTQTISGGSIVNNGLLNYNQAIAGSYAGAISGTGTVLIDGGGPVTLTGAITSSGGVRIGDNSTGVLSNASVTGNTLAALTGNNATLTVASGGTITATNGIAVLGAGANGTVNNGGTVTSTGGFAAVYLNPDTGTDTVTNSGAIYGAIGIYAGERTALNVTNSGTVFGGTMGMAPVSGNIAIQAQGDASITNSGLISSYAGILANSTTQGLTVDNQLTGIIRTTSGNAIQTGGAGVTRITNAGLIERTDTTSFTGIAANGAGGLILINAGTIRNNATVSSAVANQGGSATVTNTAVRDANGTLIGGIINAGTGTGVTFISGTANSVTNSGRITGGNDANNGYGVRTAAAGVTATVTNQSGGLIEGATGGIRGAGTSLVVDNSGVVRGTGTGSAGVSVAAGTLAVTNNTGSLVVGVGGGVTSNGAASISNAGTIGTGTANASSAFVAGGTGDAVTLAGGALTNTGTIDGANRGVVVTAGIATITNTRTIVGHGSDGITALGNVTVLNSGTVRSDTNSGIAVGNAATATITNAAAGTLTGGSNATYGYGVQSNSTGAVTFDNYGIANGSQGGIVSTSAAMTINLQAGSTTGAVRLAGGNDVVTLFTGNTRATALTTTYADAVSGATGTVILQNAGTNAAAIVGALSLGGGTNTLNLNGAGDGTSANGAAGALDTSTVTGATIIAKNGTGTWALSGQNTGTTAVVTVNAGLLTVAGGDAIANAAAVTVNAAGTLGLLANETVSRLSGAGNVALGANVLTLAGAGDGIFTGVASGSGGIVKQGAGTLTLSGANSFTGLLDIQGGIVRYGADNVLANTVTVTVGANTTLDLASFSDTIGTLNLYGTLANGGRLTAANYNVYGGSTVGQSIGGGALNVYGNSTLNSETDADPINIYSGTLTLGSAERLGDTAAVYIAAMGELALGGNETIGALGNLNGSGGLVTLNGGLLTVGAKNIDTIFSGTIRDGSAAGSVTKTGSGTLTLAGSNSYTGVTTIAGGTLAVNGGQAIADTGTVQVDAGTTFQLLGRERVEQVLGTGAVLLSNGSVLSLGAGGSSFALTATASGSGGIDKDGAGTLTLATPQLYTGTTNVNAGTLLFGASDVLDDASTLHVAGGATADLGTFNDTVLAASFEGRLAGSGLLTAQTYRLEGATIDANLGLGALTVEGKGVTSTLNGHAAAETVSINAGTLLLGGEDRLSDDAALRIEAVLPFDTPTLDLNGFDETVRTAYIAGRLASTGTPATLSAQTYTLAGATVDANLGAGAMTVTSGKGVTQLNGTAGAATVTIDGTGNLVLGAAERLNDAAAVTVASGGVLNLQGFDEKIDALVLGGTLDGTGTLTARSYDLNNADVIANLGTGVLTNSGGTSTLRGTAAAGTVDVAAGTLVLASGDRLADTAAVSVAAGAALNIGEFTDTVGSLVLSGTLDGTGTLTADSYALNGATLNANLGAGVLVNTGGVSTLFGTAGAGIVNVAAGSLVLAAAERLADGAAVSVASGATLDLGAFAETVDTLALNGTLAGTGTLTARTYTLNGGTAAANLGTGALVNAGGASTLGGTSAAATVAANAGTLTLGAADRLDDGAAVTIATAATLDLGTFNDTVDTLALNGTLAGTGTLTARTYTLTGGTAAANLGTGTLTNAGGASTLRGTSAAAAVAVNAGTLTLGAADRLDNGAAVTVATLATLNLGAFSDTVDTLALNGTLAGTGTLTARTYTLNGGTAVANLGTGTLTNAGGSSTLNGTSAATIVNLTAGTLTLGAPERLADAAAVTVAAGAQLALGGTETIGSLAGAGTVGLGAGTLVTGGSNASTAFGGTLTGTGGLTKTGTGSFTLSGTNSYTGATTINAGTLAVTGGSAIADASIVTVAAPGTLLLQTAETIGGLAGAGAVTLGANTLTVASTGATTFAGVIAGAGGLTKTGAGTLTLSGANSFTGATAVTAGTLTLGASNVLADATAVTVGSGAVLDLRTNSDTVNSLALNGTLAGTGTLTAATYALNGAAVNGNLGAGTLTQGGGTSTLTGTSAAATVNVAAGTLALGAANRLADAAAVTVASGAVLDLGAFTDTVGALALNGTLNGTGTLTAASYLLNGAAVNGNLGAGTLTQAGGISMLAGTSAAGAVNVNAGTLRLGAANRLADAGAVMVANGAILDLGAFSDTVGSVALNGTLNGTGTLTAASYLLNGASVNGNLGAGMLTQAGGISTLAGTSAAGAVNVNAGTLRLGAANRLADAGAVTVANGAILDLGAFSDTVASVALNGTLNGTGTLTAASYLLNGASVNANLGAGTLTQAGGISTLAGTSAAAAVNVNAGVLQLTADERLADTAAVSVASGATFDLNGRTETVASVTGAGTTALGAGPLVLAGAGASSLGALTGTGIVDKTGPGTLTLANNYAATGSINTAAGTTLLTGATAGGLRVTGGTLSGTGAAAGTLTVTGGTVSPGTAAGQFGTLTVGGLAMTGGTLAVDVGGAAAGFGADLLRVTGAASLGGTVAVNTVGFTGNERFQQTYLVVQAGSLSGSFANAGGFVQATGDTALFYRLRYDLVANGVVVQVQRQIDFAAALAPGTINQRAVAAGLGGAAGAASDSFAATLNAIAGSNGNRGATFDSLSGEGIADVTTTAFFASDRFVDLLRDRLGLTHGGAAAAGHYALRAGVSNDGRHASGFAGQMQQGVDGQGGVAGRDRGVGAWLQGYGAGRELEGRAGQATTHSFVDGLSGGLDGRFGDVTLGAAGGFTGVDTRVENRATKFDGTLYQGGAYLGYDSGAFYAAAAGNYFSGDVTIRRTLFIGATPFGQASGRTNVRGYTVAGIAGARFDLGGGTRAGFELTGSQTQATRRAYTETASGGLALAAARDRRDVFTGTAQVKLSHVFTGNGWTAEPFATGGVQVNSGDLAAINALRFTGAPTGTGGFLVEGARLERTLGVFTGGIEVRPSDKFRIDLTAGGAIGNRTTEGQVRMSARLGF